MKSDFKLQLVINSDGPPRRGSFEVSVASIPTNDVGNRTLIWTGLKNTPRAAKFPTAEKIFEDLKRTLQLEVTSKMNKRQPINQSLEVGGTSGNSKNQENPSEQTKRSRSKKQTT